MNTHSWATLCYSLFCNSSICPGFFGCSGETREILIFTPHFCVGQKHHIALTTIAHYFLELRIAVKRCPSKKISLVQWHDWLSNDQAFHVLNVFVGVSLEGVGPSLKSLHRLAMLSPYSCAWSLLYKWTFECFLFWFATNFVWHMLLHTCATPDTCHSRSIPLIALKSEPRIFHGNILQVTVFLTNSVYSVDLSTYFNTAAAIW